MVPWPFYKQIFVTCWECYDFEAALTHEVGHILGFGHPDLVPQYDSSGVLSSGELSPSYIQFANNATNVYNSLMADQEGIARYPNESSCTFLWEWVEPGVPTSYALNSGATSRTSIMESFTQNNPTVCISQDDLEGLNTLYPVCSGATVTPVCDKSELNIGSLRMVSYVVFPGVIGMLLSVIFHTAVESQKAKEHKRVKAQAKWLRAGNHALRNAANVVEVQASVAAAKVAEVPSGVEVTVM
eukprot:CAMPEP_0181244412 /NCGR_PEP_ID=MMETSP1096-20121128/42847_1 /TAXON_ID=156174 ORGANISM="Chrysochromulina ericina, Strain CCMP281" /NCGR_SAMPLE_ID=MMETSP1096 /ASSEMBLY_ACC=CAM_ASM_000453 /LENGTH=241 /DNA_ID=CAMNT_0023340961 /DNA_START=478 /DNA_END=1203 /DNA_ORIENTATION=+